MLRYMTFARIFLILSIINFARAAPVTVRRVHEVHEVHVNVAQDGTVTPQKRWDDWPANSADQPETSAPTTWRRLPDFDHSGLHSPRSNNAPSSSALSTGPHPRSKDGSPPPSSGSRNSPIPDDFLPGLTQADNTLTPISDYSPLSLGSPNYSPSSSWTPEYSPSSPEWSPDYSPPRLLSTDRSPLSTDYSPPSLGSPNYSPPSSWTQEYSPPSASWADYSPPSSRLTDHPLSPILPPTPGGSLTWSHQYYDTDGYPQWPPNPVPNLVESVSESEPEDFLDMLLKGKIRRRVSGSGAVDLA